MATNPFVNALAATTYITTLVSLMSYAPKAGIPEDGFIIPIAMLSLFVLSAALMGYFFIYYPLRLLVESKPNEAVKLFLSTIAAFGCTTGVLILSWIFLSARLSVLN